MIILFSIYQTNYIGCGFKYIAKDGAISIIRCQNHILDPVMTDQDSAALYKPDPHQGQYWTTIEKSPLELQQS